MMDSGQDLIIKRDETMKRSKDALVAMTKAGHDEAKATENYEIAFAKMLLIENTKDTDKIPVTIMKDIVKGNPEIAHYKSLASIAHSDFKVCEKSIEKNDARCLYPTKRYRQRMGKF